MGGQRGGGGHLGAVAWRMRSFGKEYDKKAEQIQKEKKETEIDNILSEVNLKKIIKKNLCGAIDS